MATQVSKNESLKCIANNLNFFYAMVDFFMGNISLINSHGIASIENPVDNEETAILGAALATIGKEKGIEIVISEDDICEIHEFMKLEYTTHKFHCLGLMTELKEKDEYGFPVMSVSKEQIEMMTSYIQEGGTDGETNTV